MPIRRSALHRWGTLFAILFLAQAVANAALMTTQYTSEGTFLSSGISPGFYKEGFEAPGTPAGDQGVSSKTYGTTFKYVVSTVNINPDNLYAVTPGGTPPGQVMSVNSGSSDLLFTFDTVNDNVTAAGAFFFNTDLAGARLGGTVHVTFTFSDNTSQAVDVTSQTSGAGDFLGFSVSGGTIKSITAEGVGPGGGPQAFVAVNDLYAGINPVPELPSTGIAAALFCLLIAGRALVRPRRCVQ